MVLKLVRFNYQILIKPHQIWSTDAPSLFNVLLKQKTFGQRARC